MSSNLNSSNPALQPRSAGLSSLWRSLARNTPLKRHNVSDSTLVVPTSPNLPNPPSLVYHFAGAGLTSNVHYTIPVDAFDAFFGTRPTNTQNRIPSPASTLHPPPYSSHCRHVLQSTRPALSAEQEPPTLARLLFLYGFVFCPFWLIGVMILVSPLRSTSDWEDGKPEHEREQLLQLIRTTEKKWAYRCLVALSLFVILIVLIAITIRFALHKSSS